LKPTNAHLLVNASTMSFVQKRRLRVNVSLLLMALPRGFLHWWRDNWENGPDGKPNCQLHDRVGDQQNSVLLDAMYVRFFGYENHPTQLEVLLKFCQSTQHIWAMAAEEKVSSVI